jgi:uncharacterized protein HemX
MSYQNKQKIVPFTPKTSESGQIQTVGERILIERFSTGENCSNGCSPASPTPINPLLPIAVIAGIFGLIGVAIALPSWFNSQAFQLNQQLKFQQQQTEQLQTKITKTNECLEGIK